MFNKKILTVSVTIMCCDLLTGRNRFYCAESDIPPTSEEDCVVVTIVLRGEEIELNMWQMTKKFVTYIYKPGWTQEEVVLLQLLRVNDTKVSPCSTVISRACALQFSVLILGQVGHGSL